MEKQYTFDEAINTVLELKDRFSTMPTKEDYDKVSDTVDLNGLANALGVCNSKNGARPYAAVNIAVLRELRKREGRKVFIAVDDNKTWPKVK